MIGLSFVDLSNTSKDEEFLQDAWSQGVAGSAVEPRYHTVLGAFWNNHCIAIAEYCHIFDQLSGITVLAACV